MFMPLTVGEIDNMKFILLQWYYTYYRYRANAKQAVDNLTFGVQRAECFGLLGKLSYIKSTGSKNEVFKEEAIKPDISECMVNKLQKCYLFSKLFFFV